MGQSISNILSQKNIIVLDIRTNAEFCSGHICGAVHVPTPLPPLDRHQMDTLREELREIVQQNPTKTFAVYCKKGIRAGYAVNLLKEMGANALSLGGVLEYKLRDYLRENACYCSG